MPSLTPLQVHPRYPHQNGPTSSPLHTPTSPASSSGWRSMFRIGKDPNGLKKVAVRAATTPVNLNDSSLSLAIETQFGEHGVDPSTPTFSAHTDATPLSGTLTPLTPVSTDGRYSLNSATTSSDGSLPRNGSLAGVAQHVPTPLNDSSQLISPAPSAVHSFASQTTPASSPSRNQAKTDRYKFLGRNSSKTQLSQSAISTQNPYFPPTPPPHVRRPTEGMSPKAEKSNAASRFIRRVASAPNAKGLFSASRSNNLTTKNGLLAPSEPVPPLPTGAIPSSMSPASSEKGMSSMETSSSRSSKSPPARQGRALSTASAGKADAKAAVAAAPGRAPFRRTYSSNSIKIGSVRFSPCPIDILRPKSIRHRSRLAQAASKR